MKLIESSQNAKFPIFIISLDQIGSMFLQSRSSNFPPDQSNRNLLIVLDKLDCLVFLLQIEINLFIISFFIRIHLTQSILYQQYYIVGMKVLALISGGKDSIYNICRCIDEGHQIVALGNLYNNINGEEGAELDSYMYQTVGTNVTLAIAEALGKPIYRRPITGTPKNINLQYNKAEEGDEVQDLQLLVQDVLTQHPEINAISSGAIFSTYQKLRVENICQRHELTSIAYLWHQQQKALLRQMIDYGMQAILIKVACYGLNKNHLGKTLSQLQTHFLKLYKQCEMNVCGQGGQYESLVLNCPHFNKRLTIVDSEVIELQKSQISPVAYLLIKKVQLTDK